MREVEVLHDYLLDLFNQDPNLTPKDVVVMVVRYKPIHALYSGSFRAKNGDAQQIPFSLSDNKLSESDVLVIKLLNFIALKRKQF